MVRTSEAFYEEVTINRHPDHDLLCLLDPKLVVTRERAVKDSNETPIYSASNTYG